MKSLPRRPLPFGTLLFALAIPLVLVAVVLPGCDLNEEPYGRITPDDFFQNEDQFLAALAPVYAQLRPLQTATHNIQEHTSDEIMVPTRGTDWADSGNWRELTQHAWTANHTDVESAWTDNFTGVARANNVLATLANSQTDLANQASFEAELRFLRAFYYHNLLDLYGRVPVVVEQGGEYETEYPVQPTGDAANRPRAEVYSFVLNELTGCSLDAFDVSCVESPAGGSALAGLPAKGDLPYGRATQGAAQALLARLLINGEVYSGEVTADGIAPGQTFYEEAARAAELLINSGDYMLADDFLANFAADNADSPENIFVVNYSAADQLGMNIQMRPLHYNQLAGNEQGGIGAWNGFTTIAEFYQSYDIDPGPDGELGTTDDVDNDRRADQFLVGRQFDSPDFGCSGDGCYSEGDPLTVRESSGGGPLDFTADIPSIILSGSVEQPGIRYAKFGLDPNQTGQWSGNDYPFFRLGEMYLIRAEALNEMGQPGAAASLVETIRERSATSNDEPEGDDDAGDNADLASADQGAMRQLILQERGYEMFYEMTRRADLIRYQVRGGTDSDDPYAPTFNAPWLFKEASDGYRQVLPIPQEQIGANANLTQNPGY